MSGKDSSGIGPGLSPRAIGWLAAITLGVLALGQCSGRETGASTSPSVAAEAVKPAQVATVDELLDALRDNEIAAKARFENAPITISGRVDQVQDSRDAGGIVLFKGNIGAKVVLGDKAKLALLRPGQKVTLRCGRLLYVLGFATPQDCRIV